MNSKIQTTKHVAKILLTVAVGWLCLYVILFFLVLLLTGEYFVALALLLIPGIIPLIWLKKKKVYLICYCGAFVFFSAALGIQYGIYAYEQKITIDVTPNINVYQYSRLKKIQKLSNTTAKR